ncbi:hypothetical protein [Calidifontibacter indicus]|uniref:hypothetical protein n=1 Tax=Calidifontibacter indicus TaxID=419650 RepID=UPI003D75EB24
MSKVHHWVKRWLTLGALEIVERQPRAGRAITRYRTVADEFVVPEELLPASLLERQLTDLNREFLRGVFRAVPELEHRGSLRIHRQPGQRHVSVDRCPGRGAARSMLTHQSSMTLLLSQDEAKELVDDLLDLRDRWLERAGGEGRRPSIDGLAEHLVMLGTTPAAPRN